jgi:uncharacterized protein YeaO (DUF488 family)
MPIRTKRWNDPADPSDGHRLLVCRYRPRGVAKSEETWNAWDPNLAPSKDLHAAAYGKDGRIRIAWESYRRAYLQEMLRQKEAIRELARSSACEREHRCHRSLLKELIDREAERLGGEKADATGDPGSA